MFWNQIWSCAVQGFATPSFGSNSKFGELDFWNGCPMCPFINCACIFIGAHRVMLCFSTKVPNQCWEVENQHWCQSARMFSVHNREVKQRSTSRLLFCACLTHRLHKRFGWNVAVLCRVQEGIICTFSLTIKFSDFTDVFQKWTERTNCCGCLMSLKCPWQETVTISFLDRLCGENTGRFFCLFWPIGSGWKEIRRVIVVWKATEPLEPWVISSYLSELSPLLI